MVKSIAITFLLIWSTQLSLAEIQVDLEKPFTPTNATTRQVGDGTTVDTCPSQVKPTVPVECTTSFMESQCSGMNYGCSSLGNEVIAICCNRGIGGTYRTCSSFCSACGPSAKCFHKRPMTCTEYCAACQGDCTCTTGSRTCITRNGAGDKLRFEYTIGLVMLIFFSFVVVT